MLLDVQKLNKKSNNMGGSIVALILVILALSSLLYVDARVW